MSMFGGDWCDDDDKEDDDRPIGAPIHDLDDGFCNCVSASLPSSNKLEIANTYMLFEIIENKSVFINAYRSIKDANDAVEKLKQSNGAGVYEIRILEVL